MRPSHTKTLLLLTLLLLLWGCSATPLPAAFRQGQGHERRGDHSAALAAYRRALKRCPDAEACLSTRLRVAEQLDALGRHREALESYLRTAREVALPRGKARALHRAGRICERRLHDPRQAALLYRRAVVEHPDEIGAEDGLRDLTDLLRRRQGEAAALRSLLALYPQVRYRAVADNLLFTAAAIYTRGKRPREALALYERLLVELPKSPLRDDALWEAAQLDEAQGRWRRALRRYRQLLAKRDYPLLKAGSYNSVYVDDAQLRRGEITWRRLRRPKRALEIFRQLRDDFPHSRLRDDAQLHIAVIIRGLGQDVRACHALVLLLRRFPDGNRCRKARALQRSWNCKPLKTNTK